MVCISPSSPFPTEPRTLKHARLSKPWPPARKMKDLYNSGMTAVYVLRHPETTWNVTQRYQGRLDSPVTDEGREQAKVVAKSFAGSPLDAVYSSPLRRSLCLADELVRVSGAPLRTDNRLTEIGQGIWEGLYLFEIKARYPDLFERWYLRPDTVVFPGGESLRDVSRRGLSALADIFYRHPDDNVAVVT